MKTVRLILSALTLGLLLAPDGYGQLTNDYCTNAIVMVSGVIYSNDTSTATSVADPVFSCGTSAGRGVWYQIKPTNNQYIEISTCTSGYDTVLAVYTNTCGAWGSPVVCNDSNGGMFCAGDSAGVRFVANSNQTYYLLVGGNNNTGGTLRIKADLIPPPSNDRCDSAIAMNYGQEYSVSNIFYATEVGDPAAGVTRGVWYRVTTAKNQRVNLTTCATSGIDYTKLVVYTNGCDPNSVLTSADAVGPYCSYRASVSFSSVSNQTYYILVGASGATVPSVTGVLRITADLQDAPTNDVCANAIAMNYGQEYSVSNIFYATEVGDPAAGVTRGVWYRVTTAKNQRVNLTTCATSGIDYTKLVVYTNGCDPNSVLTSADAVGPYCSYRASVSFSSVSNQTYYILVGASGATVPSVTGVLRITADLQDAPANDRCDSAIAMNYGQEYSVSNIFYATEVGDPAAGVTRGVWYRVTTAKNQRVNLTTCATSGIDYTKLVVYTNGCDPSSVLTSADTVGPYCSYRASVSFSSVSNQTYYILVGASGATVPSVTGVLRITADLQDAPTNDVCANAIAMNYGQEYSVSNIFYATEVGDPAAGVTRGVWYRVTTAKNQRVNLTTCATSGIDYTKLVVYTNGCDPNSVLTSADAVGPYCSYRASVSFSSVSNQTYYILVGASGATVPSVTGVLRITADMLPAAPSNDVCANAIEMTNGVLYVVTNMFHATEIGDPSTNCGGNIYRGVWYKITPPAGVGTTISTCNSDFPTTLTVYKGICGSFTNFLCANQTGPAICANSRASVNFFDTGGQTYYVLASASSPDYNSSMANTTLRIVATTGAPQNDYCTDALDLQAGAVTTVNTLNATEAGDPTNCVTGFGRGVWFKYTPSGSGKIGVTTCGSTFDTGLSVYTGACGSLTNVACNDDGNLNCSGGNASLTFPGVAGTPYLILAGGKSGAGGNLQILVTAVDLVSASLTATNPAGGLLTAGRNWSVNWGIQNQGTNVISTVWTDSLYLSNIVTHAVVQLAGGAPGGHGANAGGGYNYGFTQPLPQIPAGDYVLVGIVDLGDQVAETSETNNVTALSLFITNLPPQITLLSPTNHVEQTNCVPMRFKLTASAQPGSYTITNVSYYANGTNLIGQAASAPYVVTSLALPHGVHTITAVARDNFNLTNTSGQDVSIAIRWPTNLHVLRGDIATNGDFVGCMCAYAGSNYVVWATTNLSGNIVWQGYVTNLAADNVLSFTNSFTNRMVTPQRYFRAQLIP